MAVELALVADDGHVCEVVAGEGVPHVARQRVALRWGGKHVKVPDIQVLVLAKSCTHVALALA